MEGAQKNAKAKEERTERKEQTGIKAMLRLVSGTMNQPGACRIQTTDHMVAVHVADMAELVTLAPVTPPLVTHHDSVW